MSGPGYRVTLVAPAHVADDELGRGLRERLRLERTAGIDVVRRVAMRLVLC